MAKHRATSWNRRATADLVRSALASVPSDVDRDTWVRVGMAIKSELGADAGFDLWSEWSARGESYKPRDAHDAWRSMKASGGTTIGTLFGIAKDYGWQFPDTEAASQAPAMESANPAELQRAADERRQQREAEAAEYRRRADQAARDAQRLWDEASDSGDSPYLRRKHARGYGVRFLPDGTLLVPMRNGSGELQNLQRIAPEKPANGSPEKRFLPGGRKSGLWHQLGTLDGATAVLLAEGYATGATVHEATNQATAVAFDAGNLVHVARALRELLPRATLLVCGDDDRATEARTGRNPGRDKAATAARAVATENGPAGVVLPQGLAEGGTDFNDLAVQLGLQAVRDQVQAALAAPAVPKPRRGGKPAPGSANDDEDDGEGGPPDDRGPSFDLFELVTDDDGASARDPRCNRPGVWFCPPADGEGNRKRPSWLCAPLHVEALTRNDDSNGWGVLLEFTDPDRRRKSWAMPLALLSGEGAEWAGRLRDMGLRMAPGRGARNLLAQYLDTRHPDQRVTCTDRVGWHNGVFVQPSRCVGEESAGRRYVFQTDAGIEDTFRQAGTLAQWRDGVSSWCAGNSRLVFAVCCAFAGPLMGPLSIQTGGFHLVGDSSLGKTTALLVAASVWGSPKFKQQWRTTDNALEATASQHSDCLLILDEIGQAEGRIVGECAYMLANEQEKGRATRANQLRRRRTWRLLFLSSGEKGLADHMQEAGKKPNEGQLLRIPSVPADAGAGLGMLEQLHGEADGKAFVDNITKAAARTFGTAGVAWLEWLAQHLTEVESRAANIMGQFEAQCVPEAAHPQVRRVASRFAVVAAAGELATKAGLTGWELGEAVRAVRSCFEAWLAKRRHLGNGEHYAMASQVKQFLETNGDALFTPMHRLTDDHRPNTPLRVGFRRLVDSEGTPIKLDAAQDYIDKRSKEELRAINGGDWQHFCLPEQFRRQVCKGFDADQVARVLRDRGHLMTEGDRLTVRQRIPGMGDKVSVYLVKPSIFGDDFEDL